MQVAVGRADHDLLAQQPAQLGRDRGAPVRIHVGVADQREVGPQHPCILAQERLEVGRARFLLAFEQQDEARGQGAVDGLPGAAGLDKGHQLALVVGGAPAADHGAVRRVLDSRVEGRAVPQLQRIDGLHVVMAVEQQAAALARRRARHHHRMAGRVHHRRVESEVRQFVPKPVRGRAHVRREGGIGRDRGDAQEGPEPFDRPGQPRVQPLQHLVQPGIRGHVASFPEHIHRVPLGLFASPGE